jgi:hypothetical protein
MLDIKNIADKINEKSIKLYQNLTLIFNILHPKESTSLPVLKRTKSIK